MASLAVLRHALAPALLIAAVATFLPRSVDVRGADLTLVNHAVGPMHVSFVGQRSRCVAGVSDTASIPTGRRVTLRVDVDQGILCRFLPPAAEFEVVYCPEAAGGVEPACERVVLRHTPTAPKVRVAVAGEGESATLAAEARTATVEFRNRAVPAVVDRDASPGILSAVARQPM